MAHYKLQNQILEAVEFQPHTIQQCLDFCEDKLCDDAVIYNPLSNFKVRFGDYIIKTANGQFYPMPGLLFLSIFKIAEE